MNRQFFDRLIDTLMPVFAVLAAFAVGAVILLLQGVNPLEAYQSMIIGAFGSKNGLSDTLVKATPLLLVGLGIAIAFRGGVINIGAEGQIIMGSLFTTWVGLQLGNQVSGVIVIIIGLLAGAFMGGI
ncbi:MAG: ABC transporter permease [Chloroflexi bacterium]|nr:ABC transporter permease [Chloroflexota bacterium]